MSTIYVIPSRPERISRELIPPKKIHAWEPFADARRPHDAGQVETHTSGYAAPIQPVSTTRAMSRPRRSTSRDRLQMPPATCDAWLPPPLRCMAERNFASSAPDHAAPPASACMLRDTSQHPARSRRGIVPLASLFPFFRWGPKEPFFFFFLWRPSASGFASSEVWRVCQPRSVIQISRLDGISQFCTDLLIYQHF